MWGGAACLLLLPLVAMQFTDEVNWDQADFLVMGTMLLAACSAFELAARMSAHWAYRAGAAVAIVTAFLLVWINLAVGIIGTENNPANLMFAGVLAIGAIAAAIARLRPRAMARAMLATALAQALVAAAILFAGWGVKPLVLTAFFVASWLLSAALFRHAALERSTAGAGP